MTHSPDKFSTGEDVDFVIGISVTDSDDVQVPVGDFDQIRITLYYSRNGVKFKFSWYALDLADAALIAEAAAATPPITVYPIVLSGVDPDVKANISMVNTETDELELDVDEKVKVFADLFLIDNTNSRNKKFDDIPLGTMKKDVIQGLV